MEKEPKVRTDIITDKDLIGMKKTDKEGMTNEFAKLILQTFNSRAMGYITQEQFKFQASMLFYFTNEEGEKHGVEKPKESFTKKIRAAVGR
jgi:uncharacterized SAM-dependent methyltransferase